MYIYNTIVSRYVSNNYIYSCISTLGSKEALSCINKCILELSHRHVLSARSTNKESLTWVLSFVQIYIWNMTLGRTCFMGMPIICKELISNLDRISHNDFHLE